MGPVPGSSVPPPASRGRSGVRNEQSGAPDGWTRGLIASLRAIPGPVDTLMIMGTWNGRRAAQWFTVIKKFLDANYDVV